MAHSTRQTSSRSALIGALLTAALLLPATARAQYGAPELADTAIGEKYWVEVTGNLWNPDLSGLISSEQFGRAGTEIDFASDLGYTTTRFRDLRIVLRPTKKAKFRINYTPIKYEAETTFARDIEFNGLLYRVGVPIESSFQWNVWRFGYEYDFLYMSRGFIGALADVRYTRMDARLATNSPAISPRLDEFTTVKAPLPAIGVVGRVYPLPALAVNFELSGMKVPDVDPKYQGNYLEWDLNGTYNITNNVGFSMGWRRQNTFLMIEQDLGDLKLQGLWFGAVLRY